MAKDTRPFAMKLGYGTIGLILGLFLGMAGAFFVANYNPKDKPSESEIVAASIVFDRVVSQNEMVSVSQQYNITEKVQDDGVKIPFVNIPVPLTGNSFWYRYVGTLKAGINLQNAAFEQNENIITITLDSPTILANTPDREKSKVLEENNNVLNPIGIEDFDGFLKQCAETSEEKAIEGGLLDEAKVNAEENIRNMFNVALGDEYVIEFNWREA